MNNAIRAREVRVVAPDGEQIGIKKLDEALWLADQLGLDLVEVAPEARPPVCRLMDYGKYKYEQSVKARESRKKQTRTVIKEVTFRPKISDNDFGVKSRRTVEFLDGGDKVKVTLRFRGREVDHPEIGRRILDRLIEDAAEVGDVEQTPRMDGRNMTMVLGPKRGRKTERETGKGAAESPEPAPLPAEETATPPKKDDLTAATEKEADEPATTASEDTAVEADTTESAVEEATG